MMEQTDKRAGTQRACPNHGALWDFPRRFYLCGCAMDKWTWKQGMGEASGEAFGHLKPQIGYPVEGEDDGYPD